MKINKTRTRLPWAPKKESKPFQRDQRKVEDDQSFYNKAAWRKLSELVKKETPLCEVCAAAGRLRIAQYTDHLIRWQEGGAKLDRRNLMAMCKHDHNRKSALEKYKPVLIEAIEMDGELIPKDRNQIFKILNG